MLYAGTDGGVFRSLDEGTTWTFFPDQTIDGARQEGGELPIVAISALTLTTGDVNPTNGNIVDQPDALNMLVATTAGRGTFAIRIDDSILLSNGKPLSTYDVDAVSGPHVTSLIQSTGDIFEYASTATATSQFSNTFWSAQQATGAAFDARSLRRTSIPPGRRS